MPSTISDVVFSEPSGRPITVVMFSGALAMASIYGYYGLVRDGASISPLLMAAGFALSGVAESLPAERRRMAGGLRVTAIFLLVGLLGLSIFAPDIVLGP
jgi:hypothetical protein